MIGVSPAGGLGKPLRPPRPFDLLSIREGGDRSLVASLVFKTSDTSTRRVVGSIPIHLRQRRPDRTG